MKYVKGDRIVNRGANHIDLLCLGSDVELVELLNEAVCGVMCTI